MKAWSSTTALSGEVLRTLIEASPDGLIVVDRQGLVVFANAAAARIMRPSGATLVGSAFGHPIAGADLSEIDFPATGTVAEPRVSGVEWEGRPAWLITLRDVTAGRRAAEDRFPAPALLDLAERAAGLVSWELDICAGRVTHTSGPNRTICRSLEEFLSNPFQAANIRVHPGDRKRLRRTIDAAKAGKQPLNVEHRVVRSNGEVRIARSVAEALLDEDGTPVKLRGITRDITDERRAEESRHRTYRLMEALTDSTMAAIYVKDRDGYYLFSNAAHSQAVGRNRDELGTLTTSDLVAKETADAIRQQDATVLATGTTISKEETIEHLDGTRRSWLSTRFPILDDDGRPYAVGGVSLDITDQKRAREALRLSEQRFQLLAEHSQDVIFLIRMLPDTWVEYVSPASETVLGIPPQDLLGDIDAALAGLHPEDRATAQSMLSSPSIDPVVTRFHRRDGSTAWIEIRLTAIHDESGQAVALEGNIRDVTRRTVAEQERQRLARQLEQAERLESLGRLAGGVAHDFNNLLEVIMGTAELLADDFPSDDPRRADVEQIAHTAQRGAALTRQLLIFSKREPTRLEILDLNEVVAKTEYMLRRTIGEDVEFVSQLSPNLRAVNVDRAKLEQVVLNLVVNARQAMPDGGRLTLKTDGVLVRQDPTSVPDESPPVPAGDYVRLTVADTGEGMAPEVARRVFEPFFTTRQATKGTGLGLATVRGVVTEAGGHITVDSWPGRGTVFQVYLPACSIHAAPAAAEDGVLPQGRGETVLVVEDEDPVRDVITRTLSRNNYRLLTARDPVEALEKWADPGATVDLLLTDVIMPGMSGPELAQHLRRDRPDLPVLYMSGYSSDRSADRRSPEQDVEDNPTMLTKPFQATTALRRIREALDAASASGSNASTA